VSTARVAIVWSLVAALLLYPVLRVAGRVASPEPNPAAVLWTAHAGYFARAWIATFGGCLAGIAAFVLSRGREPASLAWASRVLVIALAAVIAQAALLP
jgi:hypothetical protein